MNQVELRTDDETPKTDDAETAVPVAVLSQASADQRISLAAELHIWLRALESFFLWQHHPIGQERTPNIVSRDWTPETRIASDALSRARHLVLSVRRSPEEETDDLDLGAASGEGERFVFDETILSSVDGALGDGYEVCVGLLAAPRVTFRSWSSLGRMLRRELKQTGVVAGLERELQQRATLLLHPSLRNLAAKAKPPQLGTDVLQIFQSLTVLLDQLRYVAPLLKSDLPLKGTLPLWTLIHDDSKRLVAMIEKRALRTDEIDGTIFDALDGTAYALGMELRKVFAHELSDVASARHAPIIYSKIETAHGLLRDSFQQSIITLAQALDPELDAFNLFDLARTKLDQSLALREDLWTLLSVIRKYEREPAAATFSLANILELCNDFRDGSMQHLMYKDWEAFDLFVDELSRARSGDEAIPVLHRFGTYLDTLFGQINMRTVLKDHPFDPQAASATPA